MNRPQILLVMLLAAAAVFMAYLAVYQVDDVFIVYRYARNLAQGHGFVFNTGERVEGVTCFLWTVLLALAYAVGFSLPVTAPVLTAVAGLATLVAVARASADGGRRELAARDLLAPALLASSPGFAYWSVGALETVPFALLITLAAREHARFVEARFDPSPSASGPRAAYPLRSALWLGVASLVRPETPLIAAALGLGLALESRERAVQRGVTLARWLLPIAACFVPFLLFRRAYFGDWLPNTYYAKTGIPLSVLMADGLAYTQQFASSLLPINGPGPWWRWLAWVLLLGLVAYGLRLRALRPFAMCVLALGLAIVLEGGDWMVLHRFWVPALPSLAVIAASALLRLCQGRAGRAVVAVAIALCVGHGVTLALRERNGGHGLAVNGEGYRHTHLVIAKYLREHAAPGDAVALMDVGMIGWYAPQLDVIDITGLTDRAIAHAPGAFLDKRFEVEDLFARNPRFLVLVPRFPADERIVAHREFGIRYGLRLRLNHRANWRPPSEYWLHLFERR